ncbi:MAG: cation-translocating P-type ATPase [Salinigranum sp.]
MTDESTRSGGDEAAGREGSDARGLSRSGEGRDRPGSGRRHDAAAAESTAAASAAGAGRDWHSAPIESVFDELDAGEGGLSAAEAARRLERHGPNEIREGEEASALDIFLAQFRDFLVYLLVLAAVLSLAVGLFPGEQPNYVDAGLILLILLANGVFGFVQDYRAERSMQALRDLSAPDATVLRDGEKRTVDAREVVPGDVVFVEGGDAVPADGRLLSAGGLQTDEAALTGESATVEKGTGAVDPDTPLAERSDMVYMNTTVGRGRGTAVVVATGMDTRVGSIATQLETAEDGQTPFQEEVDALGKQIGYGVVGLIALIALTQLLFTAASPITVALVGITLAVAAVPEGLPAVVTLTLALGSRRLLEKNALVRRLPVVESLGGVDVIVTDKTGTLTESRMTVRRVLFGGDAYEVTGAGLETEGEFRTLDGAAAPPREATDGDGTASDGDDGTIGVDDDGAATGDAATGDAATGGDGTTIAESDGTEAAEADGTTVAEDGEAAAEGDAIDPARLEPLLRCGMLCNDAERAPDSADEEYYGDPTEVALLVSAAKAGVEPDGERVGEFPFTSDRKRMTVLVDEGEAVRAYTKGAPEVILDRCDRVLEDGEVVPLTDERRAAILDRNRAFAADALRVLGFASRDVSDPDADEGAVERDMVFLGLQGMLDPPREGVAEAVADCRAAGIRVVMATGDNVETARAIGEGIGFDPADATTGTAVEGYTDGELREAVEEVEIFARVAPEHKVRILRAIQANDHDVAMTGDGVNDAPALRAADVGISMGVRGTDVAKQASDVVLRDDNFVTIRDAVAEGRGIFDNLRKFVNYLLSANAGEVLVVFAGVLVGTALFPGLFADGNEALILTPVMLLWLNLVTDGFPALALGADPKAAGIMRRPPNDEEGVIDARMVASIGGIGAIVALTGLPLFFYGLAATGDLVRAQTLLFTFLVAVEMVRIQLIRSRFGQSVASNPWLVGAVGLSFLLQLLVVYTPLNAYFDVFPLGLPDWGLIAAAFVGFVLLNAGLEAVYDRVFEDVGGSAG